MAEKVTVPEVAARKRSRGAPPLVMVTAYDAPFARIVDQGGVDLILVGDSVANNVLGYEDTLHVTIDDMAHHTAAVARARPRALVVGDMPWMSYHLSVDDAVRNAATLVRAGAGAVKLEGGRARLPVVEAIVRAEIPVMGHVGLTPQSVLAMGGYRVQARSADAAQALKDAAKALAAAGCFAIVLEGVPDVVAAAVTDAVDVPTICIGAGAHCDGQVSSSTTCSASGRGSRRSSPGSMPTSAMRRRRPSPRSRPTSGPGRSRPTRRATTRPPTSSTRSCRRTTRSTRRPDAVGVTGRRRLRSPGRPGRLVPAREPCPERRGPGGLPPGPEGGAQWS